MFDRYTLSARRVIYYARFEASEFGSSSIDAEHILLGLLREDPALVAQFLGPEDSVEVLRHDVDERKPRQGQKTPVSIDLPLASDAKRVLKHADRESRKLSQLDAPHLLLGLLLENECQAAEVLRAHGLNVSAIRERSGGGA
jgi:ATP-dependent Clp protease ATP-binding subunit ClpC